MATQYQVVLYGASGYTGKLTAWRVDRAGLASWLEPAPGGALEDHLYVVDPRGDWMMRAPAWPR